MKSWKTTIGGVGMILGALAGLLVAFANGSLTTEALTAAGTAIAGGVALLAARDNSVSSEDAGVQ